MKAETSFLAVDAQTNEIVASIGPDIDTRYSPCSTFKIALSLASYELGILRNEFDPVWPYDGTEAPLESHRLFHSPKTWMSLSVIWYSKMLAGQIGHDRLLALLSQFSYGNQDLSGDGSENGFRAAHLSSSLQISPKEQVAFLKNLVTEDLPISAHAIQTTKELLFNRSISSWKVFGKTGSGFEPNGCLLAWYVGWLESVNRKYVFALLMRDPVAQPSKEERQQLVVKLFFENGIDIYPLGLIQSPYNRRS